MDPVEVQTTEVTVSTPAVTSEAPPEAVSTKAEGEGSGEAQGEGSVEAGATDGTPAAGEGAPEKPQFKPREKFKSMDKEYDVPQWMKEAIKDEKIDKEAIELLEKAYGLEPVKGKLAETRKERDHFKTEHTKIMDTIQDVRTTYQRGDIDAFLQKLAIPQERMLQWALDKVKYSQLPPEQQRMLDEHQEAQRRAWAAERQTTTAEQRLNEQIHQAKVQLLDAGLARPDVNTFAAAYDAQAGKPGAFREAVIAEGELAWYQSGGKVDLSPEQAIAQTQAKWRNFLQQTQATSGATPAPGAPQTVAGTQAAPKAKAATIPNVQGGAASPLKSKPRSIADLRKLSAQAQA